VCADVDCGEGEGGRSLSARSSGLVSYRISKLKRKKKTNKIVLGHDAEMNHLDALVKCENGRQLLASMLVQESTNSRE
jgi:hypothetical protein